MQNRNSMNSQDTDLMRFGPFEYDFGKKLLTQDGIAVPKARGIALKALDYVLRNHTRLVIYDELISAMWGGKEAKWRRTKDRGAKSNNDIQKRVRPLFDVVVAGGHEFIQVVPGFGYRFIPLSARLNSDPAPQVDGVLVSEVLMGDRPNTNPGTTQIEKTQPGPPMPGPLTVSRSNPRADFYYVGSFDDDILLFRNAVLDLDVINETLCQAVLYGGPLIVNDGYLLHYPAGLTALTDREASPLLDLIDVHYVRIYSRNGGQLAEMPPRMALHIPPYKRIVDGPKWPTIQAQLTHLQSHLEQTGGFEFWPDVHTGTGFKRLVNLAFEDLDRRSFVGHLTPRQADDVLTKFNSTVEANPELGARTTWMETFKRTEFGLSEPAKHFMLWLGIEAYHYNHAMTSCLNHPKRRVGVITRYSCLFDKLREPALAWSSSGASPSEIPKLMFPPDISREMLHQGRFLSRVATPGTELYVRKHAYLTAVSDMLVDQRATPEADDAAREYSASIADFFFGASPSAPSVQARTLLNILVTTSGAALGAAVTGASRRGMKGAFDGLFIGGAQGFVGGGLVTSKRRTTLNSTAPLVIDLMHPPESPKELPTLSNPLRDGQWFTFFTVPLAEVNKHILALPSYKFA